MLDANRANAEFKMPGSTTEPRNDPPTSRAVHRIAVLAVCLVWPLIWVGGLVTTYDAGMAVPDWPGTYGYNLFLYPYESWLLGPFDLFIEHGHRLLGAVVGLVAIALCVAAFRSDPRPWFRGFAVAVLVAVILQGLLGGVRVLLGDRTFAMIHGCTAPIVFSLCVIAAVASSRWWWQAGPPSQGPRVSRGLLLLVGGLVAISYSQLILGAQLRHVQPTATPGGFAHTVAMHVLTAVILWALTAVAWPLLRRCGDLTLSRPGLGLIGLVGLQILLGVGTWVVNYGFPSFLKWYPGAAGFLLRSKGFGDSMIVTAHVATGSLILAVATMILVRLARLRHIQRVSPDVTHEGQPVETVVGQPVRV